MKLGLLAGNGRFPFLLLDAARAEGLHVVVAAIKEETDPEMDRSAEADAGFTAPNCSPIGSFAGPRSGPSRSLPWSSVMQWTVVSVEPKPPLALAVRFSDGTKGTVRFEPSHLRGVFEALKDPEVFRQAKVEFGTVSWPGDIDLAPDAMYREIKSTGEWVLR